MARTLTELNKIVNALRREQKAGRMTEMMFLRKIKPLLSEIEKALEEDRKNNK